MEEKELNTQEQQVVNQQLQAAEMQIKMLQKKLTEIEYFNTFKRLDYLFLMLDKRFDATTITKVKEEIVSIMFGNENS